MPIFYQEPLPAKPKPVPGIVTIKQHSSWRCPLLVVLTIVVIGMIGLFLSQNSLQTIRQSRQTFIKQHWQEQDENRQQLKRTLQKNANLMAQNKELRAKLTMIVRTTQKGQKTYANVLQTLKQVQKENHDLAEELNFYKHLLTSSKSKLSSMPEIVVTNFMLDYEQKSKHYPYQLVLTQWAKDAKVAQGIVQISLLGLMNGKTKRLNMKSITDNAIEKQNYKVHYFQRLEGYLQIPEAFIPHHLIIRVLPKGRKKANEIRFSFEELQQKEQPEYVGKP